MYEIVDKVLKLKGKLEHEPLTVRLSHESILPVVNTSPVVLEVRDFGKLTFCGIPFEFDDSLKLNEVWFEMPQIATMEL